MQYKRVKITFKLGQSATKSNAVRLRYIIRIHQIIILKIGQNRHKKFP